MKKEIHKIQKYKKTVWFFISVLNTTRKYKTVWRMSIWAAFTKQYCSVTGSTFGFFPLILIWHTRLLHAITITKRCSSTKNTIKDGDNLNCLPWFYSTHCLHCLRCFQCFSAITSYTASTVYSARTAYSAYTVVTAPTAPTTYIYCYMFSGLSRSGYMAFWALEQNVAWWSGVEWMSVEYPLDCYDY